MLAMLCLLFSGNSFAQSNAGRIVGTVSDASGVIAGATVVVTDNKTGKERTVVTTDNGTFTVPQLEFGSYTVKVSASGHKTYTAQDVKVDVGRDYTLDAVLEAGDISEQVTITAGADLVNGSNAEISNTVSPRQIQELPLNGRNPIGLITLQAGTAANGAQNTSINGQRPSAPNITLDGLNIQDNFIRSSASNFTQVSTTVDDVAEFTVTTQNAGAEQGNGTAQVQLVTPRGQNDFHGALYIYNRNSAFAANDYFNNFAGREKGFRNFNQYGGRVSGPILKDRVFFFFNYEGLRDKLPSPTTRTVLTDSARQGIFTYVDTSGVTRQVNLFSLPITGTNPPTGINPLIQSRFLANIPRGNTTTVGDQRITTGYQFSQKADSSSEKYKTRLDYDINDRNTVNLVYLYQDQDGLIPDFADFNGFNEVSATAFRQIDNFVVGAYRWTPTPTFTNEIRGGYTRSFPQFPQTQPEPANFLTLPLVTNPESTYLFQGRRTQTYTLQDNADLQRGNHSIRFGGQYNAFTALRLNRGGVLPTYTLGINTTTPQITAAQFSNTALFPGGIGQTDRTNANALYALLGGIISSQAQTFNVIDANSGFIPGEGFRQDYAYENLGLYVTDQWRLTPRLTVNLGLRYELWSPVRERNGVIAEVAIPNGSDPVSALLDPNGFLQVVGGNSGNQRLFKPDKNNFAPNVSVAWSPNFKNGFLQTLFPGEGRTVLRGGFRISYFNDEFLKGSSGEGDQNPGLRLNTTRANLNERLGSQGTIATPAVQIPLTFAAFNARSANQGGVVAVDPNIQVPQNYEYNVSLQREIGWGTALEIRYVGAFSNNGTRYTDQNPIDIVSNGFLADYLRARSNRLLTGNPACTATQNPSCQALTVFPQLGSIGGVAGGLTNATILGLIDAGTPGQLVSEYIRLGATGNVRFQQNSNIFLAGLLSNTAKYNYNGLQIEVRKRFSDGLYFQANYTFQKTLTNSPGTDQRRFEFQLDPRRDELEFGRATYDQTHVFNFNALYELPFGKGKMFFGNANGLLDRIIGGWQLNTIVRLASGAPIGIFDPRGTFNTNARSTRNTAFSNLSKEEIKKLVGIYKTPNGVFFFNPSIIDPNTGRAANGITSAPFNGQVFFNVQPGEVGNVERFFLNGPSFFNVDASLFKNIRLTENTRIQLRMEAFNVFNHTNFFLGQVQNINSANFGRISQTFAPRIVQFAARFEF